MNKVYLFIGWLSTITMPAAAAANFGLAAYEAFLPRAGAWFAITVGVLTAIGFESIGILFGHTAVSFHARGDRRWLVSAAGMAAYVTVGSVELYAVPFSRFVPMLAALAYVAVALLADVETAVSDERTIEADNMAWQRKLERERLHMQHQEKLAKIEASKSNRLESGQKAVSWPSDFRLLNEQQRSVITDLSSGQLQELADISASTARRWKRQVSVNGHSK